jgi:O-antigen ligase
MFLVATVALSLASLGSGRRWLWIVGIVPPTAVIVLSFRRFAWAELAAVLVILVAVRGVRLGRDQMRRLGLVALVLVIGLGLLVSSRDAEQYLERIRTFNFISPSASKYAVTNQSHLDDILDGWDRVRENPILGQGVGDRFVGERTASWKGTGGNIHNGPLTVWVLFGALGLAQYIAGYILLILLLWRRARGDDHEAPVVRGIFAFVTAQFLVSLFVVTWPFAFWQTSILTFALVAAAFPATRGVHERELGPSYPASSSAALAGGFAR